jgi:DNA-binding CsgD family transcriptional regulator
MSITLSSMDLEKLAHAAQLLLSPLDHLTVDGWRSAVNGHLRELLCADSAGFLLPVDSGLAMYSDEHEPKALAVFPEVEPPRLVDGRSAWDESVHLGVTTVKKVYGSAYELYLRSAYYNEYAAVNGAHDTIAATIALGSVTASAAASLHFWHARLGGRVFGEREMSLLRLLFPAFRAGVETQVRCGQQRIDLLRNLDALGQAAIVFDHAGGILHQTPALTALLARDSESSVLCAELRVAMNAVRGVALTPTRAPVAVCPCARTVRTAEARYTVRALLYGGPPSGSSAYILVVLERLSPARRTDAELRERFGLTKAEIRVAVLLAEGWSNIELAKKLYVTGHTARRHTERILQKMGIHSRAQVAAWIYS